MFLFQPLNAKPSCLSTSTSAEAKNTAAGLVYFEGINLAVLGAEVQGVESGLYSSQLHLGCLVELSLERVPRVQGDRLKTAGGV